MRKMTWEHTPEFAGALCAYHFPQTQVRVEWEDGSYAQWERAFWRREGDFIVVYSEHCGYHTLRLSLDEPGGDRIEGQEGPQKLTTAQQAEYDAYFRKRAGKGA